MSSIAPNTGAKVGPTQLAFFQAILTNLKEKPEVDWVAVATKTGYNSASTARCRWAQIRRELLATESDLPVPKSPSKPRVKKETAEKEVGGGTSHSPSRVTKSILKKGRSKSIGAAGRRGLAKGKKASIGKGKKATEENGDEEDEEQYMEKFDYASDEMEVDGHGL